ncbi:MAG: ABC transporter permease [Candidatus Thermofonsia Clade 1 bacterium]|jgi:glucose/mannose transport system permease protein|uniref:ABC transporter permease n=1 Tax=Candidatus Thermofonsia Clade 1 bacterium TaxID=2364210 RepID=A0A2M8PH60_9CHLR|nr:MAG: ABC transporter permease [Candidatus Thermofonsia Clade 1 bacterium]RMF53734.1 MAG: carbohydrate ABC transporter permease [Chloroflexota bacterium]
MSASAVLQRRRWTLNRRALTRSAIYATLIFWAILYLIPIYLVLVTSLKPRAEVSLDQVWTLPRQVSLDAFGAAVEKLSPNFLNSILLTVPATLLSALIGSLNGYVLSKWRFRGANIIFPLMLFGMFIPYQSILIPLFQLMSQLRLTGTLWSLILTHVVYGLPITTLIFRNYYTEIPDELIEAGQIDGADFFKLYTEVVFPLSLPGFVVVIIWQFTQIWNEYLFAVTLADPLTQPITVALSQLAGGQAIDFSLQMAGSFLTALPTLLVYILLGRYFIRGLLAGSVKG